MSVFSRSTVDSDLNNVADPKVTDIHFCLPRINLFLFQIHASTKISTLPAIESEWNWLDLYGLNLFSLDPCVDNVFDNSADRKWVEFSSLLLYYIAAVSRSTFQNISDHAADPKVSEIHFCLLEETAVFPCEYFSIQNASSTVQELAGLLRLNASKTQHFRVFEGPNSQKRIQTLLKWGCVWSRLHLCARLNASKTQHFQESERVRNIKLVWTLPIFEKAWDALLLGSCLNAFTESDAFVRRLLDERVKTRSECSQKLKDTHRWLPQSTLSLLNVSSSSILTLN